MRQESRLKKWIIHSKSRLKKWYLFKGKLTKYLVNGKLIEKRNLLLLKDVSNVARLTL